MTIDKKTEDYVNTLNDRQHYYFAPMKYWTLQQCRHELESLLEMGNEIDDDRNDYESDIKVVKHIISLKRRLK